MSRWLLVLGLSGCSFTLSGPDPARPRYKPPECDTGKGLVVVDSLIGTALGITALALVGGNNGSSAIAPALLGAIFIGAAIHGNGTVDRCRTELDQFAAATRAPAPTLAADDAPPEPPTARPAARSAPPPPEPLAARPAAHSAPPPPEPPPAPPPADKPEPPPARVEAGAWKDFWREVK